MAWPEFFARGYLRKLLRPFPELSTPMGSGAAPAEPTLALLTSCGVHRQDDDSFDVTAPDGDPSFRSVSWGDRDEQWTISHPHFDHADLESDFELALPRRAVESWVAQRRLATPYREIPTFMGFSRDLETFVANAAAVAERLASDGVQAALLTPC